MIEMPLEKEVKQENKFWKEFTLRQIASIAAGAVVSGTVMLFTGMTSKQLFPLLFLMAGVAYLIGWYQKNSLKIEQIISKRISAYIYKNTKRRYRTRNRFIDLYNKGYRKLRQQDMKDKKTAKAIVKSEKKRKKKKSSVKSYL